MARTTKTFWRSLVLAGSIGVGTAACGASDAFGPGRTPPAGANAGYDEDTGMFSDCPDNVLPEECVPLTQTERDNIWWDILIGIKWEVPMCANIGEKMQDFVKYGDYRKYPPRFDRPWGNWREAWMGAPEQIGIMSTRLGWPSDRLNTTLHEGAHSWWQSGNQLHGTLYGPEWAEYNCINN